MKPLRTELERRRQQHLYRRRRIVTRVQGVVIRLEGRQLLNFCSNDYLGLADHPRVVAALRSGADAHGVGSGAAHLVSGHSRAHHALEEELAEFTGRARALLFSTGYMANLGTVTALLGRGDTIYQDRLNHASLIDAGLLSRASFRRYAHADVPALRRQLEGHTRGDAMVVTDGVFSMDGDLAPLLPIAALCRQHDAWLMVDDAHGFGVLGETGAGILEHYRLDGEQVPLLMGTLGKALGTFGAFVAGSEDLIETLIQHARSYVYTTAVPPAVAEATRASLQLVREEGWRRERLQQLIRYFRAALLDLGFSLGESPTPIQPILAGTAERALAWSDRLERQGILVSAIRPPTVPEGGSRLRVTLSAAHSDAHLEQLLQALASLDRAPLQCA
ncbi:MAG: 8-amino-7-oxononanoate synthase [Gammaproteobacteria bacterium]|nr:8-amino-7-oxononanoate synthase [Gammaproteobacteria bacterium]MCB1850496.1 8-amino-7-oxononanoate synthase [Gammaproteobacteria bacterium]MCP5415864.1 8-amino-7-oxononanoate synthase [Chromatiaceae bacterium]